ncbi:MAG: type II CAAX prenyl endopeptidase Rce1 family protein [Acidimicrobiales bacterium]
MTQAWSSSPPLPPANWYPDPSRVADLRYWNGWAWTTHVVVSGQVTSRPMPPPPAPGTAAGAEEHQLRLPARAALVALVGFVAGISLSIGLSLLGQLLGVPRLARLLVSQAGLWAGLLGAVGVVSRRYGTGRPLADFRVRVSWAVLGWGALMSLGARTASSIVAAPLVYSSPRLAGSNDKVFKVFGVDSAGFVVVALLAVVGAPIVEELFFRGVVQGAFLDRLGTVGALALQAVLFGLAHFNPLYGWANVTVIVAIAAAGAVLGITVRLRGLGASMIAHACFNLVAVLATVALAG